MSLKALIDLSIKMQKYEAGELSPEETAAITLRNEKNREESYARIRQWSIECEKRIAAKQPTAELLRKVCTI